MSTWTFGTMAAIVKRNQTTYGNLMTLHTSGGTSRAGIEIQSNGDANHLQWQYDGSFVSSTLTVVNADGWVLIAMGKATGTANVRVHKYVYSTDTWTHENTSGTATNSTAPGASSTMRFGLWEGTDDLNGDLAVAGAWLSRSLSDAEVEQLPFTLTGWVATAPDGLWVLDQSLTTQSVLDMTGNGANQSALTGTTVSANSVPVFNYGHDVIILSSSAAAAAGDTQAPAEATTGTGAANAATVDVTVNAETTSGTGAANASTASVAPAAEATAANGTANAAAIDATANAEATAATGSAANAAASTEVQAEATSGTGAATDATVSVAAQGEAATGIGTAHDATTDVTASAEAASATGSGFDPSAAIAVNGEATSATGAAFDATVSTAAFADALAESAAATGVAFDAMVAVGVPAEVTAGTGTANAATTSATILRSLTFTSGRVRTKWHAGTPRTKWSSRPPSTKWRTGPPRV